MSMGYIPSRRQLMRRVEIADFAISEEKIAFVAKAVAEWWGADEQPLILDSSMASKAELLCYVHNVVSQEGGIALFDAASLAQIAMSEKIIFWVPTYQNLSGAVHQYALKTARDLLVGALTADEITSSLTLAAEALKQHLYEFKTFKTESGIPILAALHALDVDFFPIEGDIVQLGQGANSRLLYGSSVEADSAVGIQVSDLKYTAYKRFKMAGIPTPVTYPVRIKAHAMHALRRIEGAKVVKPEGGNRGEGVHTHLVTDDEVLSAVEEAIKFSALGTALIQPQLKGECHRIQIINSEFIYANTRFPKSIVGNGRDTLEVLVAQANSKLQEMAARKRLKAFPMDEEARRTLSVQGLSEDTIIPLGQRVLLRSVTSVRDGGAGKNISTTIHPANIAIAMEAAQACGLGSAGVDFYSEDPTVPWYENGGMILEVNNRPHVFNRPSDRATSPTAWRMIQALRQGADKIPIHVFVGTTEASQSALMRQKSLVASGVLAWCISTWGIHTPEGTAIPVDDPATHVLPLFGNPRVAAVCLVVGEWGANYALPIRHITTLQSAQVHADGVPHPRWLAVLERLYKIYGDNPG